VVDKYHPFGLSSHDKKQIKRAIVAVKKALRVVRRRWDCMMAAFPPQKAVPERKTDHYGKIYIQYHHEPDVDKIPERQEEINRTAALITRHERAIETLQEALELGAPRQTAAD